MSSLPFRVLAGLASVSLLTTAVATAANADEAEGTVVASGLSSPRHLTVAPNGDVYVTEAGGGGGDCLVLSEEGPVLDEHGDTIACGTWDPEEHPTWFEITLGDSGAITKISRKGGQERVVTGLPSVDLGGGDVTGPSGVSMSGNKLTMTIGLGAPPEVRDMVAEAVDDFYLGFATVQQAKITGPTVTVSHMADLAQFEVDHNPHEAALDTNPNAVSADGNGWLLADAGGNDIMRLDNKGNLSLVAVFPDVLVDAPPWLLDELPPGVTQIPMEFVPTSIERGPDGAIYVSQLTGFPFPPGAASIWRIGADGVPTQWATGLTNVTDLSFGPDGSLYAVQLADDGLASEASLTDGSLLRVGPGADNFEVIATGLFGAYGVAIYKNYAYVTVGSVTPAGEVLRFDLD